MTDLAPWERDPESEGAYDESDTESPYVLPPDDALPDIYKVEASEFIAHKGPVVSRPESEPRRMAPRGLMLLFALAFVNIIGLALMVSALTFISHLDNSVRWGVGGVGTVLWAGALILFILELQRYVAFSRRSFFPAILVFGTRDQFEVVVGPGGLHQLDAQKIQGVGRGALNRLYDRAAHAASPPEMVALHYDRGSGPELVAVDWESVHDLKRGDIVWLSMVGAGTYLMYHQMIPFAPHVVTDEASRREIYAALKVGKSLFRESAMKQQMGTTKVLHTNEDGKLVTSKHQKPLYDGGEDTEIPLSDDIGADTLYEQGPPGFSSNKATDKVVDTGDTVTDEPSDYGLAKPGAPLVHRDDNEFADDDLDEKTQTD
jgi:hypothetical protein